MKVPCITLRENTEWVETVEDGWNVLVGGSRDKIDKMINEFEPLSKTYKNRFGNGDASKRITNRITIISDQNDF